VSYVLVTNLYNEETRIPALFDSLSRQTLQPVFWVWIDDGSVDRSSLVIEEQSRKHSIPIKIFRLPPKQKGNLDTIGRAWNAAHNFITGNLKADYLSVADVDTFFPEDYFERMVVFMDLNRNVGVASGRIEGDSPQEMCVPMGLGKVVRWRVLKTFDRYWDLAPDSFLNIKALSLGYRIAILNVYVKSSPMTIQSASGRFRYGRRMYYVGRSPLAVIFESARLVLHGTHASEFLRGYWQEWTRGRWRCQDADIRYYYSLKSLVRRLVKLDRRGWSTRQARRG